MGLAQFNPFILRVDDKGNITHVVGVPTGPEPPRWVTVTECKNIPDRPKCTKKEAREYMEHFRDKWALHWRNTDSQFDPATAAIANSPSSGGEVGPFLLALIQYPLFVSPDGTGYIGGTRFTGPLKPNRNLGLSKEDLADCNGDGGAFDYAVRQFGNHILGLGKRYHCTGEAINAIGRLGELVKWLGDFSGITPTVFNETLDRHDALADALQAMCIAIAKQADNPALAQGDAHPPPPDVSREKFIRALRRSLSSKHTPSRSKISDTKTLSTLARSTIYKAWIAFAKCKAQTLRNSRDQHWHSHTKRTYAGFLAFHADLHLFNDPLTGHPVFLKDVVTKVEDLKPIIHAESQRERERKADEDLKKRKEQRDRKAAAEAES